MILLKTVSATYYTSTIQGKELILNRLNKSDDGYIDNKYFNSNLLFVSTNHNAPYMLQNSKGDYYNGIEYKLSEIISKKLNKTLSFLKLSKTLVSPDDVSEKYSFKLFNIFYECKLVRMK